MRTVLNNDFSIGMHNSFVYFRVFVKKNELTTQDIAEVCFDFNCEQSWESVVFSEKVLVPMCVTVPVKNLT